MTLEGLLGIAGLIVGIAAIPISYLVARRARQKPLLCYVGKSGTLVAPRDNLLNQGLKIRFDDHEISRVSRTVVTVWNRKGDTIRGSDIVEEDPLCIQLSPGDRLLQARFLKLSRPQNGVMLTQRSGDRDQILVDFDFLDEGDGALIEVLHEGPKVPSVQGTVRGTSIKPVWGGVSQSSPGANLAGYSRGRAPRRLDLITVWITAVFFVVLSVTAIAAIAYQSVKSAVGQMPLVGLERGEALVPPAEYDLTTATGQRSFASRVLFGEPNGRVLTNAFDELGRVSLWVIVAGGIILLCMASWVIYRRLRPLIPRSLSPAGMPANPGPREHAQPSKPAGDEVPALK